MTAFLLSVHVVAAIVLVGPMTVAASLFPRYARAAVDPNADQSLRTGSAAVATAMHRISRVYTVAAVVVPVFGIATAVQMGVLTEAWLLISMALTLVAAVLLAGSVVPAQRRVLGVLRTPGSSAGDGGSQPHPSEQDEGGVVTASSSSEVLTAMLSRLGMTTGLFSLTWVVVVVLMILRPGSTTGVGL